MKIHFISFLIILVTFWSCKSKEENSGNQVSSIENIEKYTSEQSEESEEIVDKNDWLGEGNQKYDPRQTLYFSHAFIYQYRDGEKTEEFWIYHNPENGQLLYIPEDPMVDYVVSDTFGNYYFFGDDGHGVKTASSQFVKEVADITHYDESVSYPVSDRFVSFKATGNKKSLDESSKINGKEIVGHEYQWKFAKVSGEQSTYITEIIPVNFYQVYGFNKLEGDINLPVIYLDFTGIFGKNQVVTYFESEDQELKLNTYEFNPAFVEAGDYKYSVQLSNGNWKEETLPLLTEK